MFYKALEVGSRSIRLPATCFGAPPVWPPSGLQRICSKDLTSHFGAQMIDFGASAANRCRNPDPDRPICVQTFCDMTRLKSGYTDTHVYSWETYKPGTHKQQKILKLKITMALNSIKHIKPMNILCASELRKESEHSNTKRYGSQPSMTVKCSETCLHSYAWTVCVGTN